MKDKENTMSEEQLKLEFGVCEDCGCELSEYNREELEERTLCTDCASMYYHCGKCGSVIHRDEAYDYHGDPLCSDCYDDKFSTCDCCGERYDIAEAENGNAWGGMCESCSEEHFECERCGGVYSNDEYGEDGCCIDCTHTDGLHDYHDGPSIGTQFHPNPDESLYFGVELETDRYGNRDGAISALSDLSVGEELFWLEEDSSLSYGIEIISQPCTLDYHRDRFPWAKVTETVKKYGGKSHDTRTCGLHIHFSKAFFNESHSDLYQVRLVYLFEKFYSELSKFSRRDVDALSTYARKYDDDVLNKPARVKIYDLRHGYHGHYQCVNLAGTGHGSTIEIRIFKGSLRVETILASMELVDFFVHLVKKTSTPKLQAMTWEELVSLIHKTGQYRYLPDYLTLRELNYGTKEKEE